MLNFCDFIQVFVFTTNHHLKLVENVNCPNKQASKGSLNDLLKAGACIIQVSSTCFYLD